MGENKNMKNNTRFHLFCALALLSISVSPLFGAAEANKTIEIGKLLKTIKSCKTQQSVKLKQHEAELNNQKLLASQKKAQQEFFNAAQVGNGRILTRLAISDVMKDHPANVQEIGTGKTALIYLAMHDTKQHSCIFRDWLIKYVMHIDFSITDHEGKTAEAYVQGFGEDDPRLGFMRTMQSIKQQQEEDPNCNLKKLLSEAKKQQWYRKPRKNSNNKVHAPTQKNKIQSTTQQHNAAFTTIALTATTSTAANTGTANGQHVQEPAYQDNKIQDAIIKTVADSVINIAPDVDIREQQEAEDMHMKNKFFSGADRADIHEMQYALKHSRLHPNSTDSNGCNALVHVLCKGIDEAQENKWSTVNDRYAALGWLLGQGAHYRLGGDGDRWPTDYIFQLIGTYEKLLDKNKKLVRTKSVQSIFDPYIEAQLKKIQQANDEAKLSSGCNSTAATTKTESPLVSNNQTNNDAKTKK